MNLFFNKFLSNIPVTRASTIGFRSNIAFTGKTNGPQKDEFVKETNAVPQKKSKSTKKGEPLKELDNITCPYSGVKLIPMWKMDNVIKPKIAQSKTFDEKMDILDGYKQNMQKHEKYIYGIFKDYQHQNPKKASFSKCLQQLRPICRIKLKNDEFKVLNEIEKLSEKLDDPRTEYQVRVMLLDARKKIKDDNSDKIFRRKDLINNLYALLENHKKQEVVQEMWETSKKLPKSTTDFNAFVVKYANYPDDYIAVRLLYPSTSSIEHIRPSCPEVNLLGNSENYIDPGEDEMTNFMLAARDWNSGRASKPLPDFIEEHPNIPKYSQRYINDIIKSIHGHKLEGYNWYPYFMKEKLFNESEGYINLDISKYKVNEESAFYNVPPEIKEKYDNLIEKNKDIMPRRVQKKTASKKQKIG